MARLMTELQQRIRRSLSQGSFLFRGVRNTYPRLHNESLTATTRLERVDTTAAESTVNGQQAIDVLESNE